MPAVHRKFDSCTGHGCFPPRKNNQGSTNVICNEEGVHRGPGGGASGDSWNSHCCGKACHTSNMAGGSSTVYANSQPLARIGDPVACGSAAAKGSKNVFAGG